MHHKKYLVTQIIINVIVNAIVSFLLGQSKLDGHESIPLVPPEASPYDPSMAGELIVGSFIVATLLTVLLTYLTRMYSRKKQCEDNIAQPNRLVSYLPASLFMRTLCVGMLFVLTVAVPAVFLLGTFGFNTVDAGLYLLVHSVYAGFLGGAVAYVVVARALLEGAPRRN